MRLTLSALIIFLVCIFTTTVQAQDDDAMDKKKEKGKKEKFLGDPKDFNTFNKAEQLYEEGFFVQALPMYKELEEKFPDEPIVILRVGSCLQYTPNGMSQSLEYLNKLSFDKMKKTDYAFFYGKALHFSYNFDQAIEMLSFYAKNKKANSLLKKEAQLYLNYCVNGKELYANPVEAQLENIGAPVNTDASEYVPVITADESMMIFTYRGKNSKGGLQKINDDPLNEGEYYEDVYVTFKDTITNSWTVPKSIGDNINTNSHDASIALSVDGLTLFLFKGIENDEGAIYESKYGINGWSQPDLVKGSVNTESWEGSISMNHFANVVYFASERPGGLGGKDIYKAELLLDGTWGNVTNLGPNVNTQYDDDAPFIHPGGDFLIFASKGHTSMGGYDLFRVDIVDDSVASSPINLGYPINTTGDDIYYVTSADGKHGYYSSSKEGGFGLQDIYMVKPSVVGKKVALMLVSGIVTLDEKPVQAEILVVNPITGKTLAVYKNDPVTGKYLISLPSGKEYRLVIKFESYDPISKDFSTLELEDFKKVISDFPFFSPEYLKRMQAKMDSLKNKDIDKINFDTLATDTTVVVNEPVKETPVVTPVTDTKPVTLKDIMAEYGDKKVEGLEFVVQIGAYNLPQNFNYTNVNKLGGVKKQVLDDGITRFTMGKFLTLNEAYKFKSKVIDAGISDAFVTAVYKGKRYLLAQLVNEGIFVK